MATTMVEIIHYTRTVLGEYIQTVNWPRLPFEMEPNTTLNEKFEILPKVAPEAGERPAMRYFAIGNLGHRSVQNTDRSEESEPIPHSPTDAACYNHIPFVLRENTGDNDLTTEQRARYCLRKIETHNNKEYIAYYGRRIDMSSGRAKFQKLTKDEDQVYPEDYSFTTDNLNPPLPSVGYEGVRAASRIQYAATAVMKITLDSNDIAEIIHAHQIRTGSTRSPVISEIALCTGVDKTVPLPSSSTGYNEVIACQVNLFMSVHHAIGYSSGGMDIVVDFGAAEAQLAGT